jgi:alpha-galactosidase
MAGSPQGDASMKIAIIGAGGMVFPVQVVCDILAYPSLRESHIALMDIDAANLARSAKALRQLVEDNRLGVRIDTTTDQRDAISGADVVIVTFQVGGHDAYRADIEVPRRYGIDQTVGDTLGPGGVFRFLRSAPVYQSLAADVRAVSRDALVINYANPMAMNVWLLDELGVRVIGLCHSIPNTAELIARELAIPIDELEFLAAGINHQAWFLELRHRGADVYPRLRATMHKRHLGVAEPGRTYEYEGYERVRTEIMDAFGYFQSESSHHASEYLPYFRRTPADAAAYLPTRWDYLEITSATDVVDHNEAVIGAWRPDPAATRERSAALIDAIATDTPRSIYGNVRNRGAIPNLPDGCVVEVPCQVDASGVKPTSLSALPVQCAAVNRTSLNVQELAVASVLTGDREQVYRAIALDPLTSAVVRLPDIRRMVDDLFDAEARWLEHSLARV